MMPSSGLGGCPDLRVGLHLVVIEGPAVLVIDRIARLLERDRFSPADCRLSLALSQAERGGAVGFPSDQLGLGIRYFFDPRVRRQLRAEIAAQFAAFAATGLRLDHANAHKHMHLHPTVGRMLIEEGHRHGLTAIRIPAEPPRVMAGLGEDVGLGGHALYRWSTLLRRQARRAGLQTNDHAFGIEWSGRMTADRILRLAPALPAGLSELYFHPAATRDPLIAALMPGYRHTDELAALLDPAVAAALPCRTVYARAPG